MAFYETLERNIRPFWNSQYSENPKKFNEEVAERNQFFKEKKNLLFQEGSKISIKTPKSWRKNLR